MIIVKLDTKDICEGCQLFVPDMHVNNAYADGRVEYTDIVVDCKHREMCDYLMDLAKKSSPIIEEDDSLNGKVTSI